MGKEAEERRKSSVPDTPERWEHTAPPAVIEAQRRLKERLDSLSPRPPFVPKPLSPPPASETSVAPGEANDQKGEAAE
jgi:hypothetical protein